MDKIKQKRATTRTLATKLFTKIETALLDENTVLEELENLLEELLLKQDQLNDLDTKVQDSISDTNELENDVITCDEYLTKLVRTKCDLKRAIKSKDSVSLPPVSNKISSEHIVTDKVKIESNIKLPRLTIETFKGDPGDWNRFWDQFESAIHMNEQLTDVERFNYLKSFLSGKASDAIKGITITNTNYNSALETLKERFGKKSVIINLHMNKLLNLDPVKKSTDVQALRKLLDTCQIEIRNLENIGMNSENYDLLCPIIMKLLPSDIVLEISKKCDSEDNMHISQILQNLKSEAESREKAFALTSNKFETKQRDSPPPSIERRRGVELSVKNASLPSASTFLNETNQKGKCLFCNDDSHYLSTCKLFGKISFKEKKDFLIKRGVCFICLRKAGHTSKFCRSNIKCTDCTKRHYPIMCFQIQSNSKDNREENFKNESTDKDQALANKTFKQDVLLQTLIVRLINKVTGKEINVRAVADTGSEHSYLSKYMVKKIGYVSNGNEKLNHCLFGGKEDITKHNRYKIHLSDLSRNYFCNFDVFDQEKICSEIPKIKEGDWVYEAKRQGIKLSDLDHSSAFEKPYDDNIHLLIGADVYGKLLTGNVIQLKSGVVAVETRLGWTLMGKLPIYKEIKDTISALTLFSSDRKISDLWDLDKLGIIDPAEKQTKRELEEAAEEHFLASLKREPDGRYEVSLPWLSDHQPLPTNRQMAEKRLISTVKKLKSNDNVSAYEKVFREWEDEDIIERVDNFEEKNCHYLPHRAVIRENSTTKIRPVFDASAKEKNSVSLNDCLESGPNYIELIPSILNRFRVNKYGVIADIRKAFLQISLNPQDRNFLRFIWFENGNPENLIIYRHKRVVFGVNASPFLLAATLNYHLSNVPEEFQATASKLKDSFYVDNCVTSVKTAEDLDTFISQSKEIMEAAKFDLRGWKHNDPDMNSNFFEDVSKLKETDVKLSSQEEDEVFVLGLKWNLRRDTLRCNFENSLDITEVTKRKILSIAHKIFDPIGFTVPVTLVPKLLLQQCWKLKLNWDTKLPNDIEKKFLEWTRQLEALKLIEIPRKLPEINEKSTLHVFCDACGTAYATCIFLRNDDGHTTKVQLVQARAKVAPLKSISIPRLELLSCNIGARLAQDVKKDLKIENIRTYYWSDSTDVIYWIKKEENWATFVFNRVKEIRSLTDKKDWHHIPGKMNPADLPSRGSSVKALEKSRWWEGPAWLYENEENWPSTEIVPNFEIINSERRKTVVSAVNIETKAENIFDRFSNYNKILKIISLIFRFVKNCKRTKSERIRGKITAEELKKAETILLRQIQKESFEGVEDKKLSNLQPIVDSEGLIRIKSRISRRDDLESFRFPVVLPSDHPLVFKLIQFEHESKNHLGILNLMVNLRERFWVLKCRKTVRKIIQKCIRCKRFSVKPIEVLSPPLPEDRTRDANVFEITGVDLCGPLFLKDERKCWIVLFTCAVFRAVHLEITTSLSTDGFIQALRRFIARRGRPHILYSDNGSNFLGARRELKSINWEKIEDYATTKRIEWKLNPPAAPWWGGFWERLIGILKSILRKILGKASLKLEELSTLLCEAESIMNQRPLTYISEDPTDLITLTPEMFLKDIRDTGVPDLDNIEKTSINKRFSYRQRIREDLRQRFRSEYLGFLREINKTRKNKTLKEGDVVLIDDGVSKRIHWPLAKVIELYPGKDGQFRLAKLKTKNGEILRPYQRLCPLEINDNESSSLCSKVTLPTAAHDNVKNQRTDSPKLVKTRYGRTVQPVKRLGSVVAS